MLTTILRLACVMLLGMTAVGYAASPEADGKAAALQHGIQNVTGIADVYGDGEKIAAAILEYPKRIRPGSVLPETFLAEGKTIRAVYTANKPELPGKSRAGRYVILDFAQENTVYDGDLSQKPGREMRQRMQAGSKDAPMRSDRKLPDLSLRIRQVKPVMATDGTVYLPNAEAVDSTATKEPVIEAFRQYVYTDPETNRSMPYNLFLPKKYDSRKKFPLLFFVADASANINAVKTPLFQGNGATVWATDEEQAKHECIVLAPQYTADLVETLGMMTTDENKWTPGLTLITNLLHDVMDRYSVDRERIYGTGQSQGGMTNIAISDRYPNLFAGQLLVACQWNVEEMEALKDKNLWIVVCEGDTKAFPGMNEATARWEALGSKVARNTEFWDSKLPVSELNGKAREMEKQGAHINYSVFKGGNHMYTWSFAYNIDALRDWLFRQKNRG